jgi:tetratricopeptide (TPR) repeat protein
MPIRNEKERSTLLSFASRVDRNDPGALNNLGVVYFRKGMYEEALIQFKQAIKIDAKFDLARDNLRRVYKVSNIEDPDIRQWKEQVERDPDNLSFRVSLGVSYYNVGHLDEAEKVLRKVIETDPSHCMARIRLGNLLKSRGRYREALEHYAQVSDEIGDHPVYYTDLGEIYYNLGRTHEAMSALSKAISIDAGYWRPHLLMSFAYGDEGRTEDANKESEIASQLNPYSRNTEANLSIIQDGGEFRAEPDGSLEDDLQDAESTSFLLGTAYRERGYYKEALKEFELALIETPDSEKIHMELARLYIADDRVDDAMAMLAKTLEANPDNFEAYAMIGLEHHRKHNIREAAACYAQAYYINAAEANTMNNIGVLMYQCGLREDAEQMFKRGLNCNIYSSQLHTNILVANIIKEDYTTAEMCMRQFEKCCGPGAAFYEKRALLNYKLNKIEDSLKDIEAAVGSDEGTSDAFYLRGLIHLRKENFQEAIEAIVAGSEISKRFTGYDMLLACDFGVGLKEQAVSATTDLEPSDDVINMLQAANRHEFDMVKKLVEKVIGETVTVDGTAADHGQNEPETWREAQSDEVEKDPTGFGELEKMIEQLKNI